jgi:hypothetical protein
MSRIWNTDGEPMNRHSPGCRIWFSQLPCDCPASEDLGDFISGVEVKLADFEDHRPRRTFRFARSMHAEPDLARGSADILRAEMGEPGGAA